MLSQQAERLLVGAQFGSDGHDLCGRKIHRAVGRGDVLDLDRFRQRVAGIIDRFLAKVPDLKKSELQCLGITALHIAGKYEEIYPPELKNLLRVTDNAVSKEEIIKMEHQILYHLQFSVTFPSAYRFVERFNRLA